MDFSRALVVDFQEEDFQEVEGKQTVESSLLRFYKFTTPLSVHFPISQWSRIETARGQPHYLDLTRPVIRVVKVPQTHEVKGVKGVDCSQVYHKASLPQGICSQTGFKKSRANLERSIIE
uniref:Uncharacterized protein n=1 Tax=Sphaerodactylus townsendi TaxID=933632 RepID=A0ACB8FUU6_9SAUR